MAYQWGEYRFEDGIIKCIFQGFLQSVILFHYTGSLTSEAQKPHPLIIRPVIVMSFVYRLIETIWDRVFTL